MIAPSSIIQLASKAENLAYFSGSNLYPASSILAVIDATNISSIGIVVYSFQTGNTSYTLRAIDANGVTLTTVATISLVGDSGLYAVPARTYAIQVLTSGTATAGTASFSLYGQSASLVKSRLSNDMPAVSQFSTNSNIAVNTVVLGPIDCSMHRSGTIQIYSISTGAYSIQGSINGNDWMTLPVTTAAATTASVATTFGTANTLYTFSTYNVTYVRVICTTAGTGTPTSMGLALAPNTSSQFISAPTSVNSQLLITSASGLSTYFTLLTAAGTNATNIKSSAACMSSFWGYTIAGKTNFVKFYNLATAPTVGASQPVLNVAIGSTPVSYNCGPTGIRFTTGLSIAVTAGSALFDATGVTAGDTLLNIVYA